MVGFHGNDLRQPSSFLFPYKGRALNVLASMKSYVTTGEAAPLLSLLTSPYVRGACNYHICQVVHQRVAGDLRHLMLTLGLIVWE